MYLPDAHQLHREMIKVSFRAHIKHMKTFLKSFELHPLILRNEDQLEPRLTQTRVLSCAHAV